MNATRRLCLFWRILVALVTVSAGLGVAQAQVFFPFGRDHATVGQSDGPQHNGRIYIGDYSLFGGLAPCHWRLDLPKGSGTVYDVVVGWAPFGPFDEEIPAVLYTRNGHVYIAYVFNFDLVDSQGDPCSFDGVPPRRRPEGTPAPIPISNDADAFALTCNRRFAVVVGANSATPVSVVDLATHAEVSTFAYNGLGRSVAVCDDGQSVLVVLDNKAGTASEVRRLTIGTNGTLTDTGESFPFGGQATISKVFAIPGSHVGIALVTIVGLTTTSEVVSFSIPGLQMLDSAPLSGQLANAAALSCSGAGAKVYARSGSRGPNPDIIEGFALDQMTGALGDTAALTISNVSFVNVPVFANPLALSRDDPVLIASEPAFLPSPEYPSPQVTYFNAETGARLGKLEDPGIEVPGTIATASCCLVPAPLLNISTRGEVRTGNDVMIAGFIITGNDSKEIIARAIGPTLSAFGVPGALQDPMLELHEANGALVAMNDNWRETQQVKIQATGLAPTNDLESAILRTLPPASYTAVMRGKGNTTGIGLVEVYDLSPAVDSTLVNESTRGFVGADDNAMIGGIIVSGGETAISGLIVRAIGPSLIPLGVTNALADPVLEIHDGEWRADLDQR